MPELGVYFVNPASRAAIAAALMCSGVSKSGSPAPKPQTSIPSDFIAFALLSMESVRDGVKLEALEESCIKDCFRTTWASRSFQPRNSERVAKSRRPEAEFRIQKFRNRKRSRGKEIKIQEEGAMAIASQPLWRKAFADEAVC